MDMSGQILLGYVVRTFGIKGGVVIKLLNDDSLTMSKGLRLTLRHKNLPTKNLTISSVMDRGRVFFEGVDDKEGAEALRKAEIWVSRESLPALADDEYYFADMLGADIVTLEGQVIGHLIDFSSNNAQTLFQIKTMDGKLASIPSVKPIVHRIDCDKKSIVVDLPDGLLDLDN